MRVVFMGIVMVGLWPVRARAADIPLSAPEIPTTKPLASRVVTPTPTPYATPPTTHPLQAPAELRLVEISLAQAKQSLLLDPEVAPLVAAFEQAKKILDEKTKERVWRSTETAQLQREADALRIEMTNPALPIETRRAAARRNREIIARLNQIEARVKNDPEIAALQTAVGRAAIALDNKMLEKLRANPQMAPLLARREVLMKQVEQLEADLQKLHPRPTTSTLPVTSAATTASRLLPRPRITPPTPPRLPRGRLDTPTTAPVAVRAPSSIPPVVAPPTSAPATAPK
ncbi:MAG: hypothetical protein N3D11_04455 [Candidatus Sumerlaeia bacterium]|nr:hypothetical protein [Candidatus Sumerlaeia bacterium]